MRNLKMLDLRNNQLLQGHDGIISHFFDVLNAQQQDQAEEQEKRPLQFLEGYILVKIIWVMKVLV